MVPQTPQVSLNPLNPLGLDLANPDVVQINGNIINTVATDNISLNAADSTYIYINVNGDVLSQEAADRKSSGTCTYDFGHAVYDFILQTNI